MSNQSKAILYLQELKSELAQTKIEPFPEYPWTNVQAWIAKAKPIINMYFPFFSEEFNEISTEPKYRLSAGVAGKQLTNTHWKQRKSAAEGKIKEFMSFIDGIILANSLEEANSPDNVNMGETINNYLLDLTTLKKLIMGTFNLDELKEVCFELGIEYDNLPHQTRDQISRELINYMKRQRQILKLIFTIIQLRPEVNWSQVEKNN